MEFIINNQEVLAQLPALQPNGVAISSSSQPFIEANTVEMSVKELEEQHIIPVWTTTNEPLISHMEFIETVWETTHKLFPQETIFKPNIRVSHPIKGRIPEAKHKAASQLEPWESTIYYERMMFVIELPGITQTINGNTLNLTLGGVKSYNLDNLYSKRTHADQRFQMFIGFQNKICCNLCVWSDGLKEELGIKNINQLSYASENMIQQFNAEKQLKAMQQFTSIQLSETEFAQLVGRSRMYKHIPDVAKKEIPAMLLGDQQLNTVVKDFYKDSNFGCETGGDISLWEFYNLMTGANKSSYIDTFVERTVNAHDFSNGIIQHKTQSKPFWYMG
jgi:hypothetical protein